jgi:NADH dehydrogenase FAD-containing subunit
MRVFSGGLFAVLIFSSSIQKQNAVPAADPRAAAVAEGSEQTVNSNMSEQNKRIVIIGAGYAGLLAAVRLAGRTRRLPVKLTLVNAADVFVERLRLHQYAAGQTIAQRRITDIVNPAGIEFLRGQVTSLDLPNRAVVVRREQHEQRLPQVSLLTQGDFGAFSTPKVAAYMRQAFRRLNVAIRDRTTVTRLARDEALTESGAHSFDLCLWAGGFTVPALARAAGLAVNERGQVLVDPFLRAVSHPEVYAVGDAAWPMEEPGAPVRMAAFPAVLMGAHAADCLSAWLHGQTPRPFGFAWLGQGIALGRRDAVGMNNYPNDRPRGPLITGRAGVRVREFFVRYLAALPLLERRWPGAFFWLGKTRGNRVLQLDGARLPAD